MNTRFFLTGSLLFCGVIALAAPALAQTAAAPAIANQAAPAQAPVPFEDAIMAAANDLFANATLPEGSARLQVVIDPLIDGKSGAENRATRTMEARIVALVRSKYPRFEVLPFSVAALDRKPLLMIGTLTAVNTAGSADGPKDAYGIWFKLADLKTNTVISMGRARAAPVGVPVEPSKYYADSPIWTVDPSMQAYIKSCQGTRPGEMLDQAYVDQLRAAALIREGIAAYDGGRYQEALARYEEALKTPGGDQLRVHNGIYLANWKLGRNDEAAAAFAKVVDYGLSHDRLAVKFLFRVGSTEFSELALAAPYPMWVEAIAGRAGESGRCLQLIGHTSRTGVEAFNDALSAQRAERIRDLLVEAAPALTTNVAATGVGWRENIVGTGADNASDSLDRRVEFKIVETC